MARSEMKNYNTIFSLAELSFNLELIWTLSCLVAIDTEFNLE